MHKSSISYLYCILMEICLIAAECSLGSGDEYWLVSDEVILMISFVAREDLRWLNGRIGVRENGVGFSVEYNLDPGEYGSGFSECNLGSVNII